MAKPFRRFNKSWLYAFFCLAFWFVPQASTWADASAISRGNGSPHFVSSWTASPQPVWGADFIFPTNVPPVITDQTLRQIVRLSLGGERIRISFANTYGRTLVTLGRVSVGLPGKPPQYLTFDGQPQGKILPGATILSDAVNLKVASLAELVVNLYLPATTPVETFHWDARQTGWLMPGDQTDRISPLDGATTFSTRILLAAIEVERLGPAATVVVLGDSITDGIKTSMNKNARWPDFLAERLAPYGVAVVNAGISGAKLLSDGMGVHALARLDQDVLDQAGVATLLVFIGINDIGWPGTPFAPGEQMPTLASLQAGYQQLITRAREKGVKVVAGTLIPFKGALSNTAMSGYYSVEKNRLRRALNDWIRNSGAFDEVIDFDRVMQDPLDNNKLARQYDSKDQLHPGDNGSKALANAVDLTKLVTLTLGAQQ